MLFFSCMIVIGNAEVDGDNAAIVVFASKVKHPLQVIWTGSNGDQEMLLGVLEPHKQLSFKSYLGHQFDIRNGKERVGTYVVSQPEQRWEIKSSTAYKAPQQAPTMFDRKTFMSELFVRKCPLGPEAAAIEAAIVEYRNYALGRMQNEQRRHLLNREQPKLVPTFTKVGFERKLMPQGLWDKVTAFWNANKKNTVAENWDKGNSYVNHWEIQPTMAYLPQWLKDETFRVVKPMLEEWSGVALEPTACYGIRLYHRGSVLENHVDRIDTHAVSAIMNVDQMVDEPWPLYILDHNDTAHNVLIEPRDMLFYESASRIHGRPTPFKGNYFANFFVHFRPIHNWSQFDI